MSNLALVAFIVAVYCVIIVLFTLGLGRFFRYTETRHQEMTRNRRDKITIAGKESS